MTNDSHNRLDVAIRRRSEVIRLTPYLLGGMRFAKPENVRQRGESTGHERQRFCEGGCGTVIISSSGPHFLCFECREFALDFERKVRGALGLPLIDDQEKP